MAASSPEQQPQKLKTLSAFGQIPDTEEPGRVPTSFTLANKMIARSTEAPCTVASAWLGKQWMLPYMNE